MTWKIVPIVEGHGEVQALPVLLRRLAAWKAPELYVDIAQPIRVKRDRFLNKEEEFRRHLKLADSKGGPDGWILVLLDADDDCPAVKGAEIYARARSVVTNHRVSVVLANKEYEAWFIASAASLHGVRTFVFRADEAIPAEQRRDAKGWLDARMSAGYGEVIDQPAFSAAMSLADAHAGSRSFRKLCSEWDKYCPV